MAENCAWEQQRLRYGRRQRWLKWEYWSGYILYFPISLYCIFYLAIRYRGIFTITAANPAMEDGGMINESKNEILQVLKNQDDEAVPDFVFLSMQQSVEQRLQVISRAFESGILQLPVVFKPNAGQRGTGVMVIHDLPELQHMIEKMSEDHLVQEYCTGKEVSVFYYRYPEQTEGVIFSITLKTLPYVTGDGISTIKQLILNDDRHVCMAMYLFGLLKDRLSDIPEKDQNVVLNKIGAHCKGSKFEDGTHYAGEGLRKRLDQIMNPESGLCFGRFDIMVPDYENLKNGEGIKIIELNGVTSEATHIYDPRHSVFYAWKILAKQWKVAYQIGAQQRSRGHACSSMIKVFHQIFAYRKKARSYSGVSQR